MVIIMSCDSCKLCSNKKPFKKGVLSKGDVIDITVTYHLKDDCIVINGFTFHNADTIQMHGCTYFGFFVSLFRDGQKLVSVSNRIPKVVYASSVTNKRILKKVFPKATVQ